MLAENIKTVEKNINIWYNKKVLIYFLYGGK